MNFAITSYGRSGTLFLSEQLNKSNIMTVRHEADDTSNYENPIHRFEGRKNYGEVNNKLRWRLMDLPVDRFGIILRNPHDCYNSSLYKNINKKEGHWDVFLHSFFLLDQSIERLKCMTDLSMEYNFKLIYFKKMISDKEYLKSVANFFGCFDLKEDDFDLERRNHKDRKYNGWKKHRMQIDSDLGWFIEKYDL